VSAMIGNPLLLPDEGYNISRSVRLRSSASAYFNRTLTTPTSGTTWTWSAWVKRGALSVESQLFSAGAAVSDQVFFQSSTDVLIVYLGANTLVTSQVFRDPSAWYHIVLQVDTTQATASNRVRLYVNGVQVTAFSSTSYPTQNATTKFNSASAHNIGRYQAGASGYFDGYLTEINFIDGQALTPSSFGETDILTGVWKPKKYAGTYGTNGFFLNFSDNSSNTATTIGKDYSGNGNNWTPNNISVTSGSTYDSMLDVPTLWADGGNGRGNYCVLSPIMPGVATGGGAVYGVKDGNLLGGNTGSGGWAIVGSTMAIPAGSGKFYFECTVGASGQSMSVGVQKADSRFTAQYIVGNTGDANGYSYCNDGLKYNNGGTSYGSTAAAGDVIGVAVDASSSTASITFYKNNVSQGTAFTGVTGDLMPAMSSTSGSGMCPTNFGQRPFAYTPPTGFKALNTQNLPEPTIKKGNQYFDAKAYTGNGGTQTISGMQFAPDLVWIKNRGSVTDHGLFDTVRGATKRISSNLANAESTEVNSLTAFTSDGFTVGATQDFNQNGVGLVGWQWKEGATPGFDIVTYTGNGSAGRTVAHSLGVTPAMTIVKDRSNGTNGWPVWHKAFSNSQTLYLESTTGLLTRDRVTAVSSTTFTVGSHTEVNNNGNTYVAYLFAEVAGFSKFGSYTGNGSSDGPMIFTGFRPRFILLKRTDTTGNWNMYDSARSPRNADTKVLYPNLSNSEDASTDHFDWLSNGFKMKSTNQNTNGGTFIFAAFSENPFKYSLAQ